MANPSQQLLAPYKNTPAGIAITAWYDTSIMPLGAVASFTDLSGNSYNATQATGANQPVMVAGTPDSLLCDGTDRLDLPAGLLSITNADYTMAIVARRASEDGTADYMEGFNNGATQCQYVRFNTVAGEIAFVSNTSNTMQLIATGNNNLNYNIVLIEKSGSNKSLIVNGATAITDTGGANSGTITQAKLCASGSGGNQLTGNMLEEQMYNRILTTTEKASVISYLSGKWGILTARVITLPAGFGYTIPFDITYTGVVFTTNINPNDYKITPTTTYYVATTGSGANNGLSIGSPKASIDEAIAAGNATGTPYEIQVAAGTYPQNATWKTTPTQNFNIIGTGSPIISQEWETKTGFVLTTTNTYVVARSNVHSVYDSSILDSNGDYKRLPLAANQAACEATAGSYYTDNVNVWVHASDNRDLSADATDINLYMNGYSKVEGDFHGYIEGIQFQGGSSAGFDARTSSSSDTQQLYFKNCSFKYVGSGNAYKCLGTALTIMDTCTCAFGYLDGFNYHVYNDVIPTAIEINCTAVNNGWSASTSNNASTMHDGGKIVRINGEYSLSEGRNIHDVNDNTQSYNINVNSHTSRDSTDTGSVNFSCGGGSDITNMWLTNCISSGSNKDIRILGESNVYINTGSYLIDSDILIDGDGNLIIFTQN